MRKSLRMLWLPALVLAVFAMGCAQTCPPMRHGALGDACVGGPQCCAAHAGCDQMQAGCKSMGPGCGQKAAGCASMKPGCGQKAAGCASMKPGCGQKTAGCASMKPSCGQKTAGCASMKPGCGQQPTGCASMKPGCGQACAGMQACGPRTCGTVVAPSEWGPKPSLDDYLRGFCYMSGCGPRHGRGPDRCGQGPRAACGPSCKHGGQAPTGCASGVNAGRLQCGSAPAGRPMCGTRGAPAVPAAPRHCETKQ